MEEIDRRNYFMINLHESIGPGRDRTRDPWICSQTSFCNQTRYLLRYAARCNVLVFLHLALVLTVSISGHIHLHLPTTGQLASLPTMSVRATWTEQALIPTVCITRLSFEPWHEISNNLVCATSKGSDQPAHTRSLIRAFASRLSVP